MNVVFRIYRKDVAYGEKNCGQFKVFFADVAQLVEQLICNQQVVGSNPSVGS